MCEIFTTVHKQLQTIQYVLKETGEMDATCFNSHFFGLWITEGIQNETTPN